VLRSGSYFRGAKDPREARENLYREIDELVRIAARHNASGIKQKLQEIVPEYTAMVDSKTGNRQ